MELRNHSPFPPLLFQSRDVNRLDFGVVVLRGTFEIMSNQPLRPVASQEPLLLVDEYLGEPGKTSMLFENNLAPFKPRADFHVVADAIAPNSSPSKQWSVSARIGNISCDFSVTGPRKWRRSIVGWTLEPAQPTVRIPLVYENAFGGSLLDKDGKVVAYESNPIGKGWYSSSVSGTPDEIEAPTIIPSGNGSPSFGEQLPVLGLLPVPPHWKQRTSLAGTFNGLWEKTRWPDLPEDFQFDFYNSSLTNLPSGKYFRGDETVEFLNLHSVSPLRTQLPGITLSGLVRCVDGQIIPTPINLDTTSFDLKSNRAYLVWRGVFPVAKPIRVFEVRMNAPKSLLS